MDKIMINQATRRTAQIIVQNILKSTYFKDGVPLDEISNALEDMGIVMVTEYNTKWSGVLCGDSGECFIKLAPMSIHRLFNSKDDKAIRVYTPYENTGLCITWYKCESRYDNKYEVIGYVF